MKNYEEDYKIQALNTLSKSSINTSRRTENSIVEVINEKPIISYSVKEHFQFSNNTSKDLLLKHSTKTLEMLQYLETLNENCFLLDNRNHKFFEVEDFYNNLSEDDVNHEKDDLDTSNI